MKIGFLELVISEGSRVGYYNIQHVGLGRAFAELGHESRIYLLERRDEKAYQEPLGDGMNAVIHYIPTRNIGNNSLPKLQFLDSSLDALVCFSDMQIALPAVYRWCRNHGVLLLPYVGVIESHSSSGLVRGFMNRLFYRNLRVYRKCQCLTKTPHVRDVLMERGVEHAMVVPVGLDMSLMRQDYANADRERLRMEFGFQPKDKVLLFIGRLIEEKQPVRMIEIFARIHQKEPDYKLLMVGMGELEEQVLTAIEKYDLQESVKLMERIPNKDIWKLYRMADCFVNLNQQEIFGMALLEAMYYECKVVAWRAPGPEVIIEDGVSGYLVETDDQAIAQVLGGKALSKQAHERIEREFTWANTARKIEQLIL